MSSKLKSFNIRNYMRVNSFVMPVTIGKGAISVAFVCLSAHCILSE